MFFLFKLEMKQRYLVGKMNTQDDRGDGGLEEVNMDTLGEATVCTIVKKKNPKQT